MSRLLSLRRQLDVRCGWRSIRGWGGNRPLILSAQQKNRTGIWLAAAALGTFSAAWGGAASVPAPEPLEVAPGVWMIPGSMLPDREPDGNTVIFEAPKGLIVLDTGRHPWHREAILSFAHAQKRKIAVIVNSHWHLDHVSGNPDLRAAFPSLRVYASDAIDRALGGFLASSAKDEARYLDDPHLPEALRADIRGDLLTIQNGAALKPDVVIAASGAMRLGGRVLTVNLAPNAATSGDVWLYDPKSRVAALGDLVTLPAPFLDTACPAGWKDALAQVAATPFKIAVPGHGAPMSPAQFLLYRGAFEAFIDCSNSASPKEECAARWTHSIQPLLGPDPREDRQAASIAANYAAMLRANGGHSKYCEALTSAPISTRPSA